MSCIDDAIDTYISRFEEDKKYHPQIVQALIPNGEPTYHWYYRSDKYIKSIRFGIGSVGRIDEYDGHPNEISSNLVEHFALNRFIHDSKKTELAETIRLSGFTTFSKYFKAKGIDFLAS